MEETWHGDKPRVIYQPCTTTGIVSSQLPGLFIYYFYGIFASQPPQLKTTDPPKVRLSDSCRSAISSWMENMSLQNVHPQTMQNVTGSRLPLVSAAFCPWCNIPTSRLD